MRLMMLYEIKVRHTVCDQDGQVLGEMYRTYHGLHDGIKDWFKKHYIADCRHVRKPSVAKMDTVYSTVIEYTKQSMAGDCEFYFKKVFKNGLNPFKDDDYNLMPVFRWLDDIEAVSQV